MEIRVTKATGLIEEIEIEYMIIERCFGIDVRKKDRKKVKVDIDLSKIKDLSEYDIFFPIDYIGERLDDFLVCDEYFRQQIFRNLEYVVYDILAYNKIIEYLTGIVDIAEGEEIDINVISIKKWSDLRMVEGEKLTLLAADVSVTREESKLPKYNFSDSNLDITTAINDKDELVDDLKRAYISYILKAPGYDDDQVIKNLKKDYRSLKSNLIDLDINSIKVGKHIFRSDYDVFSINYN